MIQKAEVAAARLSLNEVAAIVQGRLEGDGRVEITGIAPVREAGEEELGFLADRAYLRFVDESHANGLLVSEDLSDELPDGAPPRVVARDAHLALSRLLEHLHPPETTLPGVHSTAILGEGVELGRDVEIGPYAVLGDGVRVGARARVGPHVTVGERSAIGPESVLHPQVVLYPGTVLGRRVILHAGVKIGVDGFGYVHHEGRHRKVPQVGGCVIEDDVEIGANSCVDRGSIGRTRIGAGSKLDNLIQVGHNVDVGQGSILVAQMGVAGSTRIGKGVQVGGQAGITGHVTIGDGARIGGQAGVVGDVPAGETVSGYPARNHREFLRGIALAMRLPALKDRVRALERKLEELEEAAD